MVQLSNPSSAQCWNNVSDVVPTRSIFSELLSVAVFFAEYLFGQPLWHAKTTLPVNNIYVWHTTVHPSSFAFEITVYSVEKNIFGNYCSPDLYSL